MYTNKKRTIMSWNLAPKKQQKAMKRLRYSSREQIPLILSNNLVLYYNI